jgi:multidrug resistance protein MdtO
MSVIDVIRDELLVVSAPRMSRILRMTAVVALVLMFSMAKQIPDVALSMILIFAFAQRDVTLTVTVGVIASLAVTVAIALALLCFVLGIGEPAVRVPLMVAFAFGGMYLMSASPVGAIGLYFGFVPFYALTFADWMSSPEALVRQVLWAWVVVLYPVGLLVLADLVFGARPAEIYRRGIAARLGAAAAYLGAGPDRDIETRTRLERYVRLGAADLTGYVPRSGPKSTAPVRATLLRQTELLGVLLRDLPDDLRRNPVAEPALRRASLACEGARNVLLGRNGAIDTHFHLLAAERHGLEARSPAVRAVVLPLVNCVQTVVLSVHELAREPVAEPTPLFILPKSRSRPADVREGIRFAAKVTLAATAAYLLYTGLDWYGIHTATITCFLVAQASVGATIHKLTLRLIGAIVGSALAMLSIVFVLPAFQSIGGLTVLIALVTVVSAWVATSSPRIAYIGLQIAMAFYLAVLQGSAETTKLSVGRDRIFGVLLGNVLMSVVFTSIWPVRAAPAQRGALARAVRALAAILRTPPDDRDALDRAESEFDEQITKAHQYDAVVFFERGHTNRALKQTLVDGLFVSIHAIVHTPVPADTSPAARSALANANASIADWLGAFATTEETDAPAPPPPSPEPAPAMLEGVAAEHEAPEVRAQVHQHVEWLELIHARCVELEREAT